MAYDVDYTTTVDDITIKCSKTFDQLGAVTAEDLRAYAVAGIYEIGAGRAGISAENVTPGGYQTIEANTPVNYVNADWSDVRVTYNTDYNPAKVSPHYGFTILVYGSEWQNIRSSTNDTRLVLDIPIQKIYADIGALTSTTITKSNDGDASELDSITYYSCSDMGVIKTITNDTQIPSLHLMDVFIYNDENFFIFPSAYKAGRPWFSTIYWWHGNTSNASGALAGTVSIQPYYSVVYLTGAGIYANMCNDDVMQGNTFDGVNWGQAWRLLYTGTDSDLEQCNAYIEVTYSGAGSPDFLGSITFYPQGGERIAMLGFANSSIKFKYNNTMYKPIIAQGVVIDYTDDMSEASEFDDIETVTGNNVPIEPPGPTPPGPGYDDDPWSGVSFSGVGVGGAGAFAKCYYMTSTELANLRSWMNSNNVPEGFDPMAQIIGLSQVPVSLSGDDNSTVQFVNSSAVYDPGVTRLVDSGVTTQIAMGTPIRYSLGSVDIARRMQERGEPYLDYDCQIELYLPLIGMFSLDTQAVMGRTITAEAVLDPISGTLAAYAYVSRDGQNLPIAYGSTTIGVDLPISAQQYSVSRAALKQANAQLGASILSSTLSFIAAATAGGKGSGTGAKTATGTTNGLAAAGIREAGADYMKASQAGNVFGDFMQWGRTIRQLSYGNNTAIAGSFGGSTAQWSYPFTPYVKIIRPRYEKPSNYAHSQGVPCVQTKSVGSCTGFIQCIGVDVSGIAGATDIELQAIQAALANGVFAGGGA